VKEIIAANSAIIDGFCRGRYTVPFAVVPTEIEKICTSQCLGDLLPAVHRNSAEQHKRAAEETRQAMALLDRIQQGRLSLQEGDDASQMATGGPVIVSTPATPRIFSITDEH
jgi:phage gp36-like protein